jgi:hypothetical protein
VEFAKTRGWLEEESLQLAAVHVLRRCLVVPQVCENRACAALAIAVLRGCRRGTVDQTRAGKVTIAEARAVLLEMLHEDVSSAETDASASTRHAPRGTRSLSWRDSGSSRQGRSCSSRQTESNSPP